MAAGSKVRRVVARFCANNGSASSGASISVPASQKIEYDDILKQFKTDFVFEGIAFPYYYGFIPKTKAGDGDTLDAIVVAESEFKTGDEVECKAIGIAKIIDRGEVDDKIIAVPIADALSKQYQDINDLPGGWLQNWKDFLGQIALQKQKTMTVEAYRNAKEAYKVIKEAMIGV
jgi:inorganic pyrophosphatase